MRDDFWGEAMVFVALRVGGRRHVSAPSGNAMTHPSVNDRLIMPPAGRARNKLTKPLKGLAFMAYRIEKETQRLYPHRALVEPIDMPEKSEMLIAA